MLENKDVIAKPSHGRFFPVTVAETKQVLRDLQFVRSPYRKRLDIIFRNSNGTSPHGRCIAALHPPYEIGIYSVPEDVDHAQAKLLLVKAMRELAEFGRDGKQYDRRRQLLYHHMYNAPDGALIITKYIRKGTQAKYRGDSKFSNAYKPKGIKTDEQIIKSVSLI